MLFHSPLIEPILDEFERCARGVDYSVPDVDLVSNLTGCPLGETVPLDANYWRRHARETVRFAESIRSLHARGIRAFLEIGPAPVLIGMARQSVKIGNGLARLPAQRSSRLTSDALEPCGTLFVMGANPNWGAYDRPSSAPSCRAADLSFPKRTVLVPDWLSNDPGSKRPRATGHPLLGMQVPVAGRPGEHIWMCEKSVWNCVPG